MFIFFIIPTRKTTKMSKEDDKNQKPKTKRKTNILSI